MSNPETRNTPSTGQLASPYPARHARLAEELQRAGMDALVLNPGPTLTYLTGLHFHLMERPVVAIFTPGQPTVIVLPELETGKLEGLPYAVESFSYGEDLQSWDAAFHAAALAAHLDGKRVGVEPLRLRLIELRFLEAAAGQASFVSAEPEIAALRMRKDATEIAAMQQAVEIAQQALQATLPAVRVGMTERELASELSYQLLRAGAQPEFPFPPIVSAGPNAANPHAVPGERPLQPGDLLVIDWGAMYDDYCSDLTRTFAIGEVDAEWQRIAAVVREANEAGRAACRPGIPAGDVDKAARAVIEAAGYGDYFIHRTGHGLGMESHEAPYMRSGNPQILEPGMTFTVEPGIYIAGQNGVRIEDNVAITSSGAQTLSNLPRELITLG